jgi:hypothetical protein
VNLCTDASSKANRQDKPCDTRDDAPRFAPPKARAATEANARDGIARLTGAMDARDVAAMPRLFAAGFKSGCSARVLSPWC